MKFLRKELKLFRKKFNFKALEFENEKYQEKSTFVVAEVNRWILDSEFLIHNDDIGVRCTSEERKENIKKYFKWGKEFFDNLTEITPKILLELYDKLVIMSQNALVRKEVEDESDLMLMILKCPNHHASRQNIIDFVKMYLHNNRFSVTTSFIHRVKGYLNTVILTKYCDCKSCIIYSTKLVFTFTDFLFSPDILTKYQVLKDSHSFVVLSNYFIDYFKNEKKCKYDLKLTGDAFMTLLDELVQTYTFHVEFYARALLSLFVEFCEFCTQSFKYAWFRDFKINICSFVFQKIENVIKYIAFNKSCQNLRIREEFKCLINIIAQTALSMDEEICVDFIMYYFCTLYALCVRIQLFELGEEEVLFLTAIFSISCQYIVNENFQFFLLGEIFLKSIDHNPYCLDTTSKADYYIYCFSTGILALIEEYNRNPGQYHNSCIALNYMAITFLYILSQIFDHNSKTNLKNQQILFILDKKLLSLIEKNELMTPCIISCTLLYYYITLLRAEWPLKEIFRNRMDTRAICLSYITACPTLTEFNIFETYHVFYNYKKTEDLWGMKAINWNLTCHFGLIVDLIDEIEKSPQRLFWMTTPMYEKLLKLVHE